ncbi:patatin-like phospholipase family protein [uncultured Draconibacterium sp.]|uniref:patatin-like phospholipase family protein n=1 Tax=uncultured Draconibacterium sp. TaxID=1573823 RepID=UPI002AA7ABAC|nr:patatin-like phospholipase family protein [uncultured Draconibacterium sp.]
MAYNIEILAINKDLYNEIEQSIISLNKVQSDFEFKVSNSKKRDDLYVYQANNYKSSELFQLLRDFRLQAKGNRPFIILIVDGFLESKKLGNLFGNVSAKEGLAVFTVDGFNHFLFDKIRYIRYYLVRYSLSFLSPEVKSHDDPDRKYCVFHKKMKKKEILNSLNSGKICDECFDKIKPSLTSEIRTSVESMLHVVSNQFPFALIMKGGGVKGLAFAGSLLVLEKYFSFDTFVGTSAGAIAALLLGAGYNPNELLEILGNKDFNDFKDKSILKKAKNLATKKAIHSGDGIEEWLNELIKNKYPDKLSKVKLSELEHHTILYSSRIKDGTLTFDSNGERSESHAIFAARCSMSIPYFFTPKLVDGIKVYDGGLRNNFPIRTFEESYPNKPFIGLFLVSNSKESKVVIKELTNIAIEGEEVSTVEKNLDKIVVIDPRPIKTTDFNLDKSKKEFLLVSGRLAALKFIQKYYPDIQIKNEDISSLEIRREELKTDL